METPDNDTNDPHLAYACSIAIVTRIFSSMVPLVTNFVDEHVAVLADAKRARSVAWSVAWFSTAGFHQMPPALSDRMKTSASQGWRNPVGAGLRHGGVARTCEGLRKPPR